MQTNVCPFPGSNAVTHIATTYEHLFSFFVFLRSSLPALCLCPFFFWIGNTKCQYQTTFHFTSISIAFVSLCSQKKPLPEASSGT